MDELSLADIYRQKEEGRLFAELEEGGRRYILFLYELYPNNTTSETFIDDAGISTIVGELTGLGPPTDPNGWGIWEVSKVVERKEQ